MASQHYKFRVHRLSAISDLKSFKLNGHRSVDCGPDIQSQSGKVVKEGDLLQRDAANEAQFNPDVEADMREPVEESNKSAVELDKPIHFILTLLTFGAWGVVWWWLILKSEGKTEQLFRGFDDAYWSYLIEREQPPAALHKMEIDKREKTGTFDA